MAVIIDTSKCNGVDACSEAGICIEICALNAMENVEGRPIVNENACPECGLCILNCPNEAISKP
jgi:MinD superfamily P-loop ATPase